MAGVNFWQTTEGGGLLPAGTEVECKSAKWGKHSPKGGGETKAALFLGCKQLTGDNKGEDVEILLTSGPATNYKIEKDGQRLGGDGTVNKTSNLGYWIDSLIKEGWPENKRDIDKDISEVFVGLRWITSEIPAGEDSTGKPRKAPGVGKVISWPWGANKESKKDKKDETKTKGDSNGDVDLDKLARQALDAVMKENGGIVKFGRSRGPIGAWLNDQNKGEHHNDVMKRVLDEEWQKANLGRTNVEATDEGEFKFVG